jgi:hypothetical protein
LRALAISELERIGEVLESIAAAALALAAASPAQAAGIKDGTSNTLMGFMDSTDDDGMIRLMEEEGIGWD